MSKSFGLQSKSFLGTYLGVLTLQSVGFLSTEVVGTSQEKSIWIKVVDVVYFPFHFFPEIYFEPFLIYLVNPLIWSLAFTILIGIYLKVFKLFVKK